MNVMKLIPKHQHPEAIYPLIEVRVGLTEDHSLSLTGTCPKCGQTIGVDIPLEQCWKDCPAPSEPPSQITVRDIAWLHAMKIALPVAP